MFTKDSAQAVPSMEQLENRTLLSASFLSQLTPKPTVVGNTVPGIGDVNPYGVAFVPDSAAGGKLAAGDVLVSNFNSKSNAQGAGRTIVEINPTTGKQTVFFQGPKGLGLTTALGVLNNGFVLVGNVPSPDGANVKGPGSLLILNDQGQIVETLTNKTFLNGPWDLTVANIGDISDVFVTNVLSGTVTRLKFLEPAGSNTIDLLNKTQIASGYQFRTDPAALVVGPTGTLFDSSTDTLYVASTGDNAIFAISDAANRGTTSGVSHEIFSNTHLRGPLALAWAPNGDLLTANGDAVNADPKNIQNSEIVEFTQTGKYVTEFRINPAAGGAFGIATEIQADDTIFAAVNDITNQLDIWDVD